MESRGTWVAGRRWEARGADSREGAVSMCQGQHRPRTPAYFYTALSCRVTESPKPILRDSTSMTDTKKTCEFCQMTSRKGGLGRLPLLEKQKYGLPASVWTSRDLVRPSSEGKRPWKAGPLCPAARFCNFVITGVL